MKSQLIYFVNIFMYKQLKKDIDNVDIIIQHIEKTINVGLYLQRNSVLVRKCNKKR